MLRLILSGGWSNGYVQVQFSVQILTTTSFSTHALIFEAFSCYMAPPVGGNRGDIKQEDLEVALLQLAKRASEGRDAFVPPIMVFAEVRHPF